jgi:hypothetical protein
LLKAYTVKGKISVSLLQQMMALILLWKPVALRKAQAT